MGVVVVAVAVRSLDEVLILILNLVFVECVKKDKKVSHSRRFATEKFVSQNREHDRRRRRRRRRSKWQ